MNYGFKFTLVGSGVSCVCVTRAHVSKKMMPKVESSIKARQSLHGTQAGDQTSITLDGLYNQGSP